MAKPMNTPPTANPGPLDADDWLGPLPEAPRLGGAGPFVINLSASISPIDMPAAGVAGSPRTHVYQIRRIEDRRTRYRLRIGPFGDEDEANAVLKLVREVYPAALTATADADDLRALAKSAAKK